MCIRFCMVASLALALGSPLKDSPMMHVLGLSPRAHQTDLQELGSLQKIRAAVLKRSRASREPCVVPNRLVHSLQVKYN